MESCKVTITHNCIRPFEFNFKVKFFDQELTFDNHALLIAWLQENFHGIGFVRAMDLIDKCVNHDEVHAKLKPIFKEVA